MQSLTVNVFRVDSILFALLLGGRLCVRRIWLILCLQRISSYLKQCVEYGQDLGVSYYYQRWLVTCLRHSMEYASTLRKIIQAIKNTVKLKRLEKFRLFFSHNRYL